MTTQEVIQAVKETHLWESFSSKQKWETVINALEMFNVPVDEDEIQSIIGEDFSDLEELQDLGDFWFKEVA
jgi:hypothetical protein